MHPGRRMKGEAGVTLIESLVSVAILGIAFAVFIGGMFTSVLTSDIHRKQATSETVLRQFAEAVKAASYMDCANTGTYAAAIPTTPTGYTASIAGVSYWAGGTFGSTCPSDNGLQKITLSVAAANNRNTELIDIVKRK